MVVYRSKDYGSFGAAGLGEPPLTSFHLAVVNAMDVAPPCVSGILPRSLREYRRARRLCRKGSGTS